MRTYVVLILISCHLLMVGCFKEDKPVTLPVTKTRQLTLHMGPGYQHQMFLHLESLTYTTRHIEDWDLALDNFTDTSRIITNYGRDIFVAETPYTDSVSLRGFAVAQAVWKYDFPSGYLDSNAFGHWRKRFGDRGMPYHVVDMGRMLPDSDRYYGIKVERPVAGKLRLVFGPLSQLSQWQTVELSQVPSERNFTYINLRKGDVITDFEPLPNDWDLLFTRYRHIFYIDPNPDQPFPYLVTGVLLNPRNTAVAVDSSMPFHDIHLDYCKSLTYSTRQDIIGYAWKTFDFTVTFSYHIPQNTYYIVKNHKGYFFKIRFLDFYNQNRERGYPTFEIRHVTE
jgi:hypothetical protein